MWYFVIWNIGLFCSFRTPPFCRSRQNQAALPEGISLSVTTHSSTSPPNAAFDNRDYGELKRIIIAQKLLQKQTGFYFYKVSFTISLLAASVAFLVMVPSVPLQMLNAIFMAFASGQVAFLGHDAGHRQIAKTARGNDIVGLIVGNLLTGVSFSYWTNKHNLHHSHVNEADIDPDINYPIFAFAPEQVPNKRGIARFIVKHQRYLFFPFLSMGAMALKGGGIRHLLTEKPKTRNVELLLIAIHFTAYFALTFGTLGVWAFAFIALHQMALGLSLGSIFAPNHKAMPLVDGQDESHVDFLRRQVLTSRNIHSNPINDFIYGGLNYQIEHHLFPSIPRNKMAELKPLVQKFCEERGVDYYETSTLQSFREILDHMHELGAPLREETKETEKALGKIESA
jgi:fatty acid desaturase